MEALKEATRDIGGAKGQAHIVLFHFKGPCTKEERTHRDSPQHKRRLVNGYGVFDSLGSFQDTPPFTSQELGVALHALPFGKCLGEDGLLVSLFMQH